MKRIRCNFRETLFTPATVVSSAFLIALELFRRKLIIQMVSEKWWDRYQNLLLLLLLLPAV